MGRVRTKTVKIPAIKLDNIEVDKETMDMLQALGMTDLPGVTKQLEASIGGAAYSKPIGGFGRRRV